MAVDWLQRLRDQFGETPEPDASEALAEIDTLLARGAEADAMARLMAQFAQRPELFLEVEGRFDDVARRLGGEVWLGYQLAGLEAALLSGISSERDEDADAVREAYGELLEAYRGEPDSLLQIRAVGRRIEEATSRGDLPDAIIRRAPRR